jgi:hypothetical protein
MRCRSLVVPRQSDSIGMNAHAYTHTLHVRQYGQRISRPGDRPGTRRLSRTCVSYAALQRPLAHACKSAPAINERPFAPRE